MSVGCYPASERWVMKVSLFKTIDYCFCYVFLATARRVWKWGGSVSLSAMTMSMELKPAWVRMVVSSTSENPRWVSW